MVGKTNWSKAHAATDEFGKQKREEIQKMGARVDRERAQRDAKQKKLVSRATRIKGSPYDAERVINMQEQLRKAGYNIAVDGLWGPKTQKAYDDYQAKKSNTIPGVIHVSDSGQTAGKPYEVIYTSREGTMNPANAQSVDKDIKTLSKQEAGKLYQNDTGMLDAGLSYLYHVFLPESLSMLHSPGLKNQVAAEIAYVEGLDKKDRERDPHPQGNEGKTYVGYVTHGKMTEQDQNVNKQSVDNNATGKTMGGYRYVVNPDGSVDVSDGYSFHVVRDFSRPGVDGQPYVYRTEKDPYENKPFIGLINDLPHVINNGYKIDDLAENFATRQGKSRTNNIHFRPGEINSRNRKYNN